MQIVRPGVVDAAESLLISTVLIETNECAPMRAPVFKGVDLALRIARYDDGDIAHEGGAEVSGIGDIDFETQVVPGVSLEHALLFLLVEILALEGPIRHAGQAFRPSKGVDRCGVRIGVGRHGNCARLFYFGTDWPRLRSPALTPTLRRSHTAEPPPGLLIRPPERWGEFAAPGRGRGSRELRAASTNSATCRVRSGCNAPKAVFSCAVCLGVYSHRCHKAKSKFRFNRF